MPGVIGVLLAIGVALFARVVGLDRDRAFYPTVLIVIGLIYVLFATIGGKSSEILVEAIICIGFVALAVIGFRTSMWFVVAGLALHGLFDLVRHDVLPGSGVPTFWPAFCGTYDVVAAVILAALILVPRRTVAERA